jgi:hypothetical protein
MRIEHEQIGKNNIIKQTIYEKSKIYEKLFKKTFFVIYLKI